MELPYRLLRDYFGYTDFRPGQKKLIDAMLSGRDVLAVMPTGAGKSICYQIAAMLLPGVTLVLSPLISLMQDQVEGLRAAGIPAGSLHSAQTAEERRQTIRQAMAGRCRLIYAAPERLEQPGFEQLLLQLPVSMIAVDEAHCISQWGHDFRPSYRRIPQFIRRLPARPVISAFTATATAQVREDIVHALGLRAPERLVTSFDRPNLHYAVRRVYDREAQLIRFVQQQDGACGIVYCLTRRKTEEIARCLCDHGISAVAYHAGMDARLRRSAQQRFISGKTPVIAATSAFGMGIDKPDVRFVVHYGMPRDMESYYQEAGRAGRDGAPAHCLLLFDEADLSLQEYLIERDPDNPALTDEEVEQLKRRRLERLQSMKRYVFSEGCLRQQILRYFGQSAPDFCGWCGSCEAASVQRDVTVEAQKILSCVYRVREQCDADVICSILRGEDAARQYAALSTFGIMRDSAAEDIAAVIGQLLRLGCLIVQENPRKRLRLSGRAREVLFHGAHVELRVRVTQAEARLERESRNSVRPALARALRVCRRRLADRRGVPPHSIFSDRMLEKLADRLPRTEQELDEIVGGSRKWDARGVLKAVEDYRKGEENTR